ncbi:metallophosphoesterase family protein [Microbulbifer sp. SSSA002]|uniref:metallophosphoesterase family protein n=1 Tax=unclassified Microbulbifer TaxID=2619833 RepID=UPI0040394DE1
MKVFAISDIHGRLRELNDLFMLISPDKTDVLIFLGDFIDRGPKSNLVIERLLEISKLYPNSRFIKGNHEEMALYSRFDEDVFRLWMSYGGDKTLESYPDGIPKGHWQFLRDLEPYVELEDKIFVHAGLEYNFPMSEQNEEVLLWNRLAAPISHRSGKRIVCGHSAERSGYPKQYGDAWSIDCAGWLTALDVGSNDVYQVDSTKNIRQFNLYSQLNT